jgi:hypothetical protein
MIVIKCSKCGLPLTVESAVGANDLDVHIVVKPCSFCKKTEKNLNKYKPVEEPKSWEYHGEPHIVTYLAEYHVMPDGTIDCKRRTNG